MRRIKLILAVAAAMATLLTMAAAPAMADHNCIGVVQGGECIGVGHDAGDGYWDGYWDDEWGWDDFDDCVWFDGELWCEVDF